jgi:uncharacterized SAM-binding protein YcdF (DUF218 family)
MLGDIAQHDKDIDTMEADIRSHADTLWRFHNVAVENPQPADLIIGLGSYLLAVADRVAELYLNDLAPRILFCGGEGNWTRGQWQSSEAERFRDHAIGLGVPKGVIEIETQSTSIGSNLANAREFCERLPEQPRHVIIVTKANTTRRAKLTKSIAWPAVSADYCSPPIDWSFQAVGPLTADDIIAEMVGDLHRIIAYPELGYQEPDTIPGDVLNAFNALIAAGYTGHLLPGRSISVT